MNKFRSLVILPKKKNRMNEYTLDTADFSLSSVLYPLFFFMLHIILFIGIIVNLKI